MRIKTNITAMNATRNQGIVQGSLDKSLEKLSSGYSINRAGDNAAGLAISEKMRSRIASLDQAINNVDDGIGMANTAEGALQEVQSILQRLKTLTVESANGVYTDEARVNIDVEREQLLDEIDRIAKSSNFDGISLFDNALDPPKPAPQESRDTDKNIILQIGAEVDFSNTMKIDRYYLGSDALGLKNLDLKDQWKSHDSIIEVEKAIDAVSKMRSSFGSNSVHLQHTKNSLGVESENINSAESCIRDTDMTEEITRYTSKNILLQSSQAMMAQANQMPQVVVGMLQS